MDPETPLEEQTSTNNTENHETAAAAAAAENVAVDKETPNALNSVDLAALQLHHLNAAQATAIAEAAAAAAAALTGRTESYQQIFASFDQNAAFAAAAAATLAACQNHLTGPAPQAQTQQTKASNLVNIAPLPSADLIKRELMNQKVRADNRERKKRWRLQNEERNKDNDLRCRVNKRAHKLFGKQDSEHKKRWVKDEFEKRQQKRKEKERKRGLVDDSLSGYAGYNTGNAINDNGMDLAAIAQQLMAQHQQPQTNLTDANNYLTLLCNNLGFTGASRPSGDNSNPPEPLPQVAEELKQEKTLQQQFPLQLLELLQQLQQYQQQEQEEQSLKESTSEQPLELPPADDDTKTEDKLAALIASTFQAVLAANDDSKSEGQVHSQANHNENNSQNTEFPMDAVLTLMQLNNAVGGNKNKW